MPIQIVVEAEQGRKATAGGNKAPSSSKQK